MLAFFFSNQGFFVYKVYLQFDWSLHKLLLKFNEEKFCKNLFLFDSISLYWYGSFRAMRLYASSCECKYKMNGIYWRTTMKLDVLLFLFNIIFFCSIFDEQFTDAVAPENGKKFSLSLWHLEIYPRKCTHRTRNTTWKLWKLSLPRN